MYHKISLENFMNKDYNQNINQKQIMSSLKHCYKHVAFSTFPYIIKNNNSNESIKKFKSGNCVALSIYLKKYLKLKYNIESFLIPATIPKSFSNEKYLNLSHVALAIPKNDRKVYIADVAFYFLSPIKVILNSKNSRKNYSKNIYQKETNSNVKDYESIDKVISKTEKVNEDMELNKYQTIPKDTILSKCYFESDIFDSWNYYLIEIKNPDCAISNFFSCVRFHPFIVITSIDKNGICESEYNIRIQKNYITIKQKEKLIEEIFFDEILSNTEKFRNLLKSYNINKFIDDDLIEGIIDYIKDVEKYKNKINISD